MHFTQVRTKLYILTAYWWGNRDEYARSKLLSWQTQLATDKDCRDVLF